MSLTPYLQEPGCFPAKALIELFRALAIKRGETAPREVINFSRTDPNLGIPT
jgi:hypothetical protein